MSPSAQQPGNNPEVPNSTKQPQQLNAGKVRYEMATEFTDFFFFFLSLKILLFTSEITGVSCSIPWQSSFYLIALTKYKIVLCCILQVLLPQQSQPFLFSVSQQCQLYRDAW